MTMRERKFGDKITITFPATSKTYCVALDFVKELPRNPRMLAKSRTKIVRRRAVLRGVDAMLDIVGQLINPTGRDLMKDMGAKMALRQSGSALGLWTVLPMKMRAEVDPFAEEDTVFRTSAAKFFDPPKKQG